MPPKHVQARHALPNVPGCHSSCPRSRSRSPATSSKSLLSSVVIVSFHASIRDGSGGARYQPIDLS